MRFQRERVVVRPSEGRTEVSGRYHFRNTAGESLRVGMNYPFPVDARHARPHVIEVWLLENGARRPVGYHHGRDSVSWMMEFMPGEEKLVEVRYVQRISSNHAVYIVTTTSEWGEPIQFAEFEFRVPGDLEDVETSFRPDSLSVRGDTVVYHASFTDFLPENDLEITWE